MTDGGGLRYVLDTDTASAYQRGHPLVIARLAASGPEAVGTTIITVYEQFRGRMTTVDRARTDDDLQNAYASMQRTHAHLCSFEVLGFDANTIAVYRSLMKLRIRIGTMDLRIASVVLARNLTLVTGNRRDFERVPELRLEDWTVA